MSRIRQVLLALVLCIASSSANADNSIWQISKSSGEVWVESPGAQQVKLSQNLTLAAGDTVRTGRTGRVLLKRGAESIAISPNSVVSVPLKPTEGLQTTIVQQAGSILLDVEKKNVSHFEVETPYLAAVVKGTQFRIDITPKGASVSVLRGRVQVADFRSGQIAQILPGQIATTPATGHAGLSLSGRGTFGNIEQGTPRASVISRVPVPAGGLTAPSQVRGTHLIHPTGGSKAAVALSGKQTSLSQSTQPARASNVIRIGSAIGEVRLNVNRHSNGLSRSAGEGQSNARSTQARNTVWNSGETRTGAASGPTSNGITAGSAGNFIAAAATSNSGPTPSSGNVNNGNGNGAGAASNGNANGNNGTGVGSGGGGSSGNGNANGSSNSGSGENGGNGKAKNSNGNGNNGGSNNGSGNGGNGKGNNGSGNGNNGSGNGENSGNGKGNNGNGNGNSGSGNNGNGNGENGGSGKSNNGNGHGNGKG